VTAAQAEESLQLGAYQVGIGGQGLETAGAALVFLGAGSGEPTQRTQGPRPPGDQWMADKLRQAREAATAGGFEAVTNPGCGNCPVRGACPAREAGRQVTA
jgi:hypothetical protein